MGGVSTHPEVLKSFMAARRITNLVLRSVSFPIEKADLCRFWYDFLAVGEAALAADWIAAWKTLPGGCASSRLDHGFPGRTGGLRFRRISAGFLIFAISIPKSGFWMLGDALEVRKAASRVGFAGERPDDGPACGRLGFFPTDRGFSQPPRVFSQPGALWVALFPSSLGFRSKV